MDEPEKMKHFLLVSVPSVLTFCKPVAPVVGPLPPSLYFEMVPLWLSNDYGLSTPPLIIVA